MNDTASRLRALLGVGGRELLTTTDLVREYKFPSLKAARHFLYRHPQIRIEHRGRTVVVDRREFERRAGLKRAS